MSKSRKNACLEDLRIRILTLDIAPGEDLDETGLSAHYGISRTPLREILQRLAGDGYATLEDNRGARATSMDLPTLRTFFQTAPVIYANISRLAAERRRGPQLAALKQVQQDFVRATGSGNATEAALLNHSFHELIGEMADNPYLMAALRRMLVDHTRLGQTFYRPASAAETLLVTKASAQHDALISAIEANDPDRAVDLTLQHWDLSRDRLERFVMSDPLPLDVISLKERRNAV